jgi:hypothetical protein
LTPLEEDRPGPTSGLVPKEKGVGDVHGEVHWAQIQDGAVAVQDEGPTHVLAVVSG